MNIFVVDRDPVKAAQMLCDEHVIKMILETAQLLSTVSHLRGVPGPYRINHAKHPATLWVNQTLGNWEWMVQHGLALAAEFRRRRQAFHNREHASKRVIEWCRDHGGRPMTGELTPFVQCMPKEYQGPDPVAAYRTFYIKEKSRFATWKPPARQPTWFVL